MINSQPMLEYYLFSSIKNTEHNRLSQNYNDVLYYQNPAEASDHKYLSGEKWLPWIRSQHFYSVHVQLGMHRYLPIWHQLTFSNNYLFVSQGYTSPEYELKKNTFTGVYEFTENTVSSLFYLVYHHPIAFQRY